MHGRVPHPLERGLDYTEIPEQDAAFFATATLRMPTPKVSVTLRLDQDVLDWLKAQGKGYQTRINAILRTYMHGVQRDTIRKKTLGARKRRTPTRHRTAPR